METEGKMLDPSPIGPGVAAVPEGRRKGLYLLVETDGQAGGQLTLTDEWSDRRYGMIGWIRNDYIRPAFPRPGVFSALYKHVELRAALDDTACGIRLYVEQDNRRAPRTYRKLGMSDPGCRVLESIFELQGDQAKCSK